MIEVSAVEAFGYGLLSAFAIVIGIIGLHFYVSERLRSQRREIKQYVRENFERK